MLRAFPTLAAVLLFSSPAFPQTLRHVRIEAPRPEALAEALIDDGYDVLEGSLGPRGFEVIVGEQGLLELRSRGLRVELLAVGRPYAQIQREALAAHTGDAVPSGYSDLAGVYARMQAAAAAHPTLAQVVDVTALLGAPPTAQGRHLFALKISDHVAQDEDEPNVLIVACHHAREIVTPEIALTAMEQLLGGYGSDPAVTAAVDGQEIWIAPVWNPDGYEHVFSVDNFWRKNRRDNGNGTFGVDLNRNFPFGWTDACSGSAFSGDETYKGPAAASEPETQTLMQFSQARGFAKVIDYHSHGREVLWGYDDCLTHPFGPSYLRSEAIALSNASGYGDERPPSADGEHYEWQLARFTNYAFLIETHDQFQPSFASAKAEAVQLWGGVLFALQRPIPLWGHVRDGGTGQPVAAEVEFLGVPWSNGESNASGGPHGGFVGVLPPGSYDVRVTAPCYQTQVLPVTLLAGGSLQLDVQLAPAATPVVYCTAKPSSIPGCVPSLSFAGTPSASAGSGFDVVASPTPGGNLGLFLYTTQGPAAAPIQNAFGWLCLSPGLFRIANQNGGGAPGACEGLFQVDFNAHVAVQTLDPDLVAGAQVDLQAWYRDPPSPGGANFTAAGRFVLCP